MSMQVEFLTTKESILANWEALEPLFQKVISRATCGEFTVDDLHAMALDGKIQIGLVRESGEIIMAMAFEFRHYAQKLAISFLAMGGKKLDQVMGCFLDTFKKWAVSAGADWIEAFCSPAMARIHARHHFTTAYQLVRLELKQKGATT